MPKLGNKHYDYTPQGWAAYYKAKKAAAKNKATKKKKVKKKKY
jgi:hypothetical protein